ncbi:unnamed protein product [Mortierella alpina]
MEELYNLAFCVTLAVAAGWTEPKEVDTPMPSMDIRRFIPQSFELQEDLNPIINIESLSAETQQRIENGPKGCEAHTLLSSEHLQLLHCEFLSPQQQSRDTSSSHPLWSSISSLIESQLSDELPKSPEGLSTTITVHIRQAATAIQKSLEGRHIRQVVQVSCARPAENLMRKDMPDVKAGRRIEALLLKLRSLRKCRPAKGEARLQPIPVSEEQLRQAKYAALLDSDRSTDSAQDSSNTCMQLDRVGPVDEDEDEQEAKSFWTSPRTTKAKFILMTTTRSTRLKRLLISWMG